MSETHSSVTAPPHAAVAAPVDVASAGDLAQTERMGVEEEFHVVDLQTRELVSRGPELLERLPDGTFTAELQRSVVESNSSVVTRLDDLRADLRRLRTQLTGQADELGLGVVAAGTVPLVEPSVLTLTDNERYQRMHEDYQLLVREQLICGTQVHVDLPDRDVAVAVAYRLSPWLPVMLALSASSPYWMGQDSGYASARSLAWQRWPTAGGGGSTSAAEHDSLVIDLVESGTISDPAMIYFDVRLSSHLPTLELRVTDSCPDVEDIVLLAGLFRALVRRERDAVLSGLQAPPTPPPLLRAAMWRASRSGLEGDLLDLPNSARPVPAPVAVSGLLEHLRAHLEAAGDWEQVSGLAERALRHGSSAAQQRQVFARRGRLADVVDHLLARTRGHGLPTTDTASPAPLLVGYQAFGDEAVVGGAVGGHYVGLMAALERLGPRGLRARERARDDEQRSRGVTFGVPGEASTRLFPLDLVPRVIDAEQWSELRTGLVQRARTLDAFLHDVYGERAAVNDGVVPAWVVEGAPGLRAAGVLAGRQAVRAHVCGVDLVRSGDGAWYVLEDNLRIPSGIGYAIQNRRLIESVLPEMPRPAEVLAVDGVARSLRETLEAAAPPAAADRGPSIVLLSSGPEDSAWFEHRMLAEEMGIPVARASELVVVDDHIVALQRDGVRTRVDVLYLRMDEESILHAVGADGRPLGAALLAAVDRGTLAMANAPGNGVADDKALYAFVGALTEYYLGEKPLLATVPTYLCGDREQREHVLEHLAELVVKPVDGYGGEGVLIGPHATPEQLASTARQVRATPQRWIAQDLVPLCTLPCFDGDAMAPRHVDLRAFVFNGERVHVPPVALTRVAPDGSMIVNSSRGGGSKDTWLLAEATGG